MRQNPCYGFHSTRCPLWTWMSIGWQWPSTCVSTRRECHQDAWGGSEPNETRWASADSLGSMNFFYTWGSILGPFIPGAAYDRTQSYQMVFAGITLALPISTTMTSLLIKPWAKLGKSAEIPI